LSEKRLKKTKTSGKKKKTMKNRVYCFVHILLITPDLLKMLMEKGRAEKSLYFEAVAW